MLRPGTDAMFSGKVTMFNKTHADELAVGGGRRRRARRQRRDGKDAIDVIESFPGGVIPVYPLVEGVTQTVVQHCVRAALDLLDEIPDPVPDVLLARHGLVDLETALRDIHRPRNQTHLDAGAAAAALRRGDGRAAGAGPAPRGRPELPGRAVPADPRRAAGRVRRRTCRSS